MANPEHLRMLKMGVYSWNKWRLDNLGVRPDLSSADLKGDYLESVSLTLADLKGADLSGADLWDADLSGADLSNANLRGAHLTKADLSGANLSGAHLSGAKLYMMDLTGANFTGTNLGGVTFCMAELENAILEYALMGHTILCDIKLSSSIGLDKVHHMAPSSLGIDTIKLSEGKLPEVFLRGCGLSPWEIEIARLYDPDLSPSDIDEILGTRIYQKRVDGPLFIGGVFISYSHEDSAFAERLYKKLQDAGVSVWLDKHDMLAGNIEKQVMRQIRLKDIVVLVLSESSIKSDWVETELEEAREKEKAQGRDVLCPVAIDDSWQEKQGVLWRKLKREKHILNFSAWEIEGEFKRQFDKLIKGMQINY